VRADAFFCFCFLVFETKAENGISSHTLPFSSLFGVSMGISGAYQSNPIAVVYDQD